MLLNRLGDVSLDPNDPWSGDPFERRASADVLTRLINSLDKSCVISVRGEWGSGKSVFLRRLGAHLEGQGVRTIHVDAWKTDYLEDPLAAFISATNARIEEFVAGDESSSERADKVIRSLANTGVKIIAPLAKVLAVALLPGGDKAVEAAGEAVRDIGGYFLQKEREARTIEGDFRAALEKARDLLTRRTDGGPIKGHVAVIIDELDRCRPDYAIRVLERIKHFFSIQGLVFIIATDHSNLPNAVATVYGEKTDGDMYLRKFIDFEFDLPEPKADQFMHVLVDDFGLRGLCENVPPNALLGTAKGMPLSKHYIRFVEEHGRALDIAELIDCFPGIATALSLQPRDQAQAFTMLNAYLRTAPSNAIVLPQVLALACALRFACPAQYRGLKKGLSFRGVFVDTGIKSANSYVPLLDIDMVRRSGVHHDVVAFTDITTSDDPREKLRAGVHGSDFARRDAYMRIYGRTSGGTNIGILTGWLPRALSLADAFGGNDPTNA